MESGSILLLLLKIKNLLEVALHHLSLLLKIIPSSCGHWQSVIGFVDEIITDLVGAGTRGYILFANFFKKTLLFRL